MGMKHVELFAGGGIGMYAAECAGIETVAWCEADPACIYALERMCPNVRGFHDVCRITQEDLDGLGRIDVVSGGFPCQDLSCAGKGAGLDGHRSGLWFEMRRVISMLRPRWLLIENVPALRNRGADIVIGGLEELGYSCWPVVVGAWAVGASHKRDRVWIVANSATATRGEEEPWRGPEKRTVAGRPGEGASVADTPSGGFGIDRSARTDTGYTDQYGEGVADTNSPGLGELRGSEPVRQELAAAEHLRFDRWPARPGEPQHEWEYPRVVQPARKLANAKGAEQQWSGSTWTRGRGPANKSDICVANAGIGHRERGTAWSGVRPTAPVLGGATDGMAGQLLPSTRRAALRVLGNAWVPQIPYLIFRWIVQQEQASSVDS